LDVILAGATVNCKQENENPLRLLERASMIGALSFPRSQALP
jgi:hypothetical protein